jgi:hypothetical protein
MCPNQVIPQTPATSISYLSTALTVSVSETPDAVLLHIRASGDVEPGSVEVRFAGRKAVVRIRDYVSRTLRKS